MILQHTILLAVFKSSLFNYKVLATTLFSYEEGEVLQKFCYVTGAGDNVSTLRPVRKGRKRVEILPKMALHNVWMTFRLITCSVFGDINIGVIWPSGALFSSPIVLPLGIKEISLSINIDLFVRKTKTFYLNNCVVSMRMQVSFLFGIWRKYLWKIYSSIEKKWSLIGQYRSHEKRAIDTSDSFEQARMLAGTATRKRTNIPVALFLSL